MTVTLTGNNSYALKKRLDELVGKFVKEHGELALERIDGPEASIEAILDAIQSVPFLASRKMVILRDLGSNKTTSEQIEQIISSVSGSCELIIYDTKIDKRTSYFKVLKAKTHLEELNDLDAPSLASWLVEEAKRQQGEISLPDAVYLVDRAGTDQLQLASELSKLITYAPEVSRANIDLLTEPAPQSKIFDLLDAAFGGDKKRAIKLYEEQRAQKVEPQAILAMVAWQLHLLTAIKYGSGRQLSDIAKDLNMNPYPVNKAAGLAKKLSEEQLKKMVNYALDIDWKGKTTPIDMDEALKTYITTI